MTKDFVPVITITGNGGRVEFYDFSQKPNRPYNAARGAQEVVGLLDYHHEGYEADLLCARCFWRGNIMLTPDYPTAMLECPACRMEGGMVRG